MNSRLDEQPAAHVIKAGSADGVRSAVLHLSDLAAQARQVVLEARQEAARIMAEARASADGAAREAYEKGFAAGLARGREEVASPADHNAGPRQAAEAPSAELRDLAARIVGELRAAREEVLHQARRQMLRFSLDLAEKVVAHVAASDLSAAQANLEKALKLAAGGDVVVRVCPLQLEGLRTQCAALLDELTVGGDVRLEADEQISPGGVKLLTRCGEIDATIETQLKNVAASLLGQNHQPLLFDMFVSDADRTRSGREAIPLGATAPAGR